MTPPDGSGGALDRAGHLSELTLDRYLYDPPERTAALRADVDAHLAGCGPCREALAALRAEDVGFALTPPGDTKAEILDFRAKRPRAALVIVPLLLAALALFIAWPRGVSPEDPGFRTKGAALELEVHVHDGTRSRLVADGDLVHPGERMGFRVTARAPGYLVILGRDERGSTYLCYPQDSGAAVPFWPRDEMTDLQVAMAFDELLGVERVVAFLCDEPRVFDPSGPIPEALPGCVRRELSLRKVAPGAEGPR